MASKNHPVRIQLKAIDQATKNVQALKREFRSISVPVRRINNQFKALQGELKGITTLGEKAGKALKSIGKGLTIGATLPIATAAVLSVKKFGDLEQAAINVRKTTGLALSEINGFVDDISRRAPLTQEALFEIAGAAGQLGVKGVRNIAIFTETMAKLERASDVAGEEGAKAVVRLLNVSGDGIGKIQQFSSALVDLGNNAAASESEILEMATRVGLATSQFKLGSKNILGIATAMKNVGIQAEAGGTVIGKTFLQIEAAILKGGKPLKALERITGQSRAQLKKTFETDATSVFVSFINGLARLKNEGVATSIALDKFGLVGDRINAVIPTMVEGSKDLSGMLNRSAKAFQENVAVENEFAEQAKGFNAAMTKVENVLTRIQKKVGAALAPAVLKLGSLFERLEKFLDNNPGFGKFLIWAAAVTAVLGPLLVGLGFVMTGLAGLAPLLALVASSFSFVAPIVLAVTSGFGAFMGIVTSVGSAIAGFISLPVVAVVGAIAGVALVMWKNWDKVKEVFQAILDLDFVKAMQGIGAIGSNTWNGIKSFFGFGGQAKTGPSLGAPVGASTVLRETVMIQKQQKEVRAVVDFGNVPFFAKVRSDGFDEASVGFNRGQMMSHAGAR